MTKMEEQDNDAKPVVQQTFNFYAPIGQQIAHVDKIEAHFDKGMGMVVNGQEMAAGGAAGDASGVADASGAAEDDEQLIAEITPCFYGSREEAREFVRLARLISKPKEITELANAWILQKKISPMSAGRDLWRPLHEHGLYEPSESNWNHQIRR